METHAQRFRFLLQEWGLTQEELGDLCGIKRGTVGTIVNGKTTPDVEALVQLKRKRPEVNWDWLLAGIGEPFSQSPAQEVKPEPARSLRPAPIATVPGQIDFVQKYITRLENDLDAAARREAAAQAHIDELLDALKKPLGNLTAASEPITTYDVTPRPPIGPQPGSKKSECKFIQLVPSESEQVTPSYAPAQKAS